MGIELWQAAAVAVMLLAPSAAYIVSRRSSIQIKGIGKSADSGPKVKADKPLCTDCLYHEYRAGRGDAYGAGSNQHLCIRTKSVVTGDRKDEPCELERQDLYKEFTKNGRRHKYVYTCGVKGQYFKKGGV